MLPIHIQPNDMVSIKWGYTEDNASGSTQCPAWRAPKEIENLKRAGATILEVVPFH